MPASNRDWANAYLKQAKEDFKAAKTIQAETPSVFCMLMQMTFEKTAKAALLKRGAVTIVEARKTHSAAGRLGGILKRDAHLQRVLGKGKWNEAFNMVVELERAHPQLAKKTPFQPQLEYPWEDENGSVKCPAGDLPIVNRVKSPRDLGALKLINLAELLVGGFHSIF